jgi:hypothetical protein
MTPTGPDERYAEGQREAADCRKCGQPIWIVYHGPSANHTVEPRPAPSLTAHEAECCRTALRAYYATVNEELDAKLRAALSAGEGERSAWSTLRGRRS